MRYGATHGAKSSTSLPTGHICQKIPTSKGHLTFPSLVPINRDTAMKIEIDEYEISDAPASVRNWFAHRFFGVLVNDDAAHFPGPAQVEESPAVVEAVTDKQAKPKKEPKAKPAEVVDPPLAEVTSEPAKGVDKPELLDRATKFIESQGPEAMQSILKKFDVRRVSELPTEKYADFLQEIAVYHA